MDKEQIKAAVENGGQDVKTSGEPMPEEIKAFVKECLESAPRVDCGLF